VRLFVCASVPAVLPGCGQEAVPRATQSGAASDSADHVMDGMRLTITSAGVRQANLEADTALVYENSGRTCLRKARLTFFTTLGVQQSTLTADSGWYDVRFGNMEARGNVVVVRADGARLTTTVLLYEPQKNQVSTDQPYTYTEGERRVQGTGFVSDPSFQNITTQAVRGTGGRYTLPGQ
jgi:LPS export ABC transporter protein LptC